MTRLPTVGHDRAARAFSRLNAAADYATLITASAPLLRYGSRLRGMAESCGPTVQALRDLAHAALIRSRWDGWTVVESRPLVCLIREHAAKVATVTTGEGSTVVYEVADHRAAIDQDSWSQLRATTNGAGLAEALMSHLAADRSSAVIRLARSASKYDWTAEVEPPTHERMSAQAARVREALAAEIPFGSRSVLLVGSAGVGKSTAARQLATAAGGTTLVLDAGAAAEVEAWSAAMAWGPSALIIEDIDHTVSDDKQAAMMMLGQLERAKSIARLVIMTANKMPVSPGRAEDDTDEDPLTRIGRVDRIVAFERMDVGLAEQIAEVVPREVVEAAVAKGWTAGEFEELRIRWQAHPRERDQLAESIRTTDTARQALALAENEKPT